MHSRHLEIRVAGRTPGVVLGIAAVLVAVGLAGVASGRSGVAVAITGGVLAAVVAEWPYRVTFDVDGVVRRSILRRHRIPWGEVDSLERLPPAAIGSPSRRGRGLAVRTVRGSVYVLSALTESEEERRAMQQAIERWAPYCRMNLLR